jgi:hypothetical protein
MHEIQIVIAFIALIAWKVTVTGDRTIPGGQNRWQEPRQLVKESEEQKYRKPQECGIDVHRSFSYQICG